MLILVFGKLILLKCNQTFILRCILWLVRPYDFQSQREMYTLRWRHAEYGKIGRPTFLLQLKQLFSTLINVSPLLLIFSFKLANNEWCEMTSNSLLAISPRWRITKIIVLYDIWSLISGKRKYKFHIAYNKHSI